MKCVVGCCITLLGLNALSSCSSTGGNRYQIVDSNRDGRISTGEMEVALGSVVFEIADADQNREVSYSEISNVYPDAKRKDFPKADKDRSRTLSPYEMEAAMRQAGAFKSFTRKVDRNSNGVIEQSEATLLHNAMVAAETTKDYKQLESILNIKLRPQYRPTIAVETGRISGSYSGNDYYNRPNYNYGSFYPHRPYSNRPIVVPIYRPIVIRPAHGGHPPHGNRPPSRPSIQPIETPRNPLIQPR